MDEGRWRRAPTGRRARDSSASMFSSFSITGAAAEVYDVELAYEDARRGRRDGERASTTTTTR